MTHGEPVLTTNRFLIGQMCGDIAPDSVDNTVFNPRSWWRRILFRRVCQLWLKEYLLHIGSTHRWFSQEENLKEGNTAVVIDPNARRKESKVRRVVCTYPGEDGLVRVVDMKKGDRVLKRPVTKLSHLEMKHLGAEIISLKFC